MRRRDYIAPLTVLGAGLLSIGLLCSVAAMALNGANESTRIPLQPLNIVDVAISNLSTDAAMTEQAIVRFLPSSAARSTQIATLTFTATPIPSDISAVATLLTTIEPTRTRRPNLASPPTGTPMPSRTKTPTAAPTRTLTPTLTRIATIVPTHTNTFIPTLPNTSMPTATNTPLSPPTNTMTAILPTNTPAIVPNNTFTAVVPTTTAVPPANTNTPAETATDISLLP